ncbi:MAG: preprotein translocase subunit SecY [Erysipelotrichaceae bacterium]
MFNKFIEIFKHKETRNRILFTLAMFFIYRLGAAISIPRVDTSAILDSASSNSIFGMLNLLGGGALEQFSIFAMGVGPYITASIVINLLSMDVIPYLTDQAKHGGAEGKKKIDQITRYLAVILAFAQSAVMTYGFNVSYGILADNSITTYLYVATIMTAGTLFLLWIGDRITMHGIGNGTSMIIFAGIISNYPASFAQVYSTLVDGSDASAAFSGMLGFIGYLLIQFLIVILLLYTGNAVRKIPIQYTTSSTNVGRKNVNYLPLKINSAGVIPIIFASAVMIAPLTIMSFFSTSSSAYVFLSGVLDFSTPIGLGIYVLLIIIFTFFYTGLQIDPEKTAENLSKNGTYIPGIRPGNEAKEYINKVLNRITVLGALSIAFIGALPYLIPMFTNLPSSFGIGGTGIIIVVGVAQETVKGLLSQSTQRNYKGFKRSF